VNVRVFRSSDDAAREAARSVRDRLRSRPASVLGLPTGRTSLGVYDELASLYEQGDVDFSQAHTFNVDEFIGLPPTDKRTYCAFMQKHLFSRINLPSAHIHFLRGDARNIDEECSRFEQEIAALGGLDLLLLGIGANAHVGFNEPARSLTARTHRTRLTLETRRANVGLFGGRLMKVPREALTMGMATMFEARAIVLIATGRAKARAVQAMLSGRLSTLHPASLLQLHPHVQVMLDSAAAEKLPKPGLDVLIERHAH
jgi:glucosamine-6-phosphate deaminase